MKSSREHWNTIFKTTEEANLGWYETQASHTIQMLQNIPDWMNSTIFLPGVGTSVLVDELVRKGSTLIVNDISSEALDRLKRRMGKHSKNITWLCHDISQPFDADIPNSDIWIDRAVLHFLLDETGIANYFHNLKGNLRHNGYVLFAEFSLAGAPKCAGLPLHRYCVDELTARLGPEFSLIDESEYTYINPGGEPRPYIYALYKRK